MENKGTQFSDGLSPGDPNSFSRPDLCKVKSIHLNLDVDFETSKLKGYVDLEIEQFSDAKSLVLDTRDLKITEVNSLDGNVTGSPLCFSMGEQVKPFGSKLDIKLSPLNRCVRVHYETSPNSSALQWMKPEQTAGKKYPYLYSQCEAIHARSMLPCQDTPSVKTPYTASISVDENLVVLMSAISEGHGLTSVQNKKIYNFNQKVAIPSYLIAIAVGALESRKIGPRSHVWSERQFVDKSAYEFAETEAMIQSAESLVGPYVWGIYDILVLPPSFPLGGMENPCLTFMSPTVLAGDRSLANVLAHEIAHSWTGNLVTNRNFDHFWLNEGFTVFLERKMVGKMNDERNRDFYALGGWKELQYEIDTRGKDNPLTRLVFDLKGVDPDDALSRVPYEKGHTFLYYLEQRLGGKEIFDAFLRAYVEKFKYQSIDTSMFKDFIFQHFKDKIDILETVDWDGWFYKPGMPLIKPKFDTSLAKQCIALKQKWIQLGIVELKSTLTDFNQLNSRQVLEFVSLLLSENAPFPLDKIELLTELYGFINNNNSEIRLCWLRLGLLSRWKNIIPYALSFVTMQGRMKFIQPIYRDLYLWEEVRNLAIETFQLNRSGMMYMSAQSVAKILHLE